MDPEKYIDLTVVTCDGKNAVADVSVWDTYLALPVTVRVAYGLRTGVRFLAGSMRMMGEVLASKEIEADIREAVLEQREELRRKN